MADSLIRRRLVVRGRVQGVFFRDSIRDWARRGAVAGWARNEPDGTLAAVLEGPGDAVLRVIELCRRGPAAARVQEIEVWTEQPEGLTGFEVG